MNISYEPNVLCDEECDSRCEILFVMDCTNVVPVPLAEVVAAARHEGWTYRKGRLMCPHCYSTVRLREIEEGAFRKARKATAN